MNPHTLMQSYCAKWLGCPADLLNQPGMFLIPSRQRNRKQRGFSSRYDLYILSLPGKLYVSFGNRAVSAIRRIFPSVSVSPGSSKVIPIPWKIASSFLMMKPEELSQYLHKEKIGLLECHDRFIYKTAGQDTSSVGEQVSFTQNPLKSSLTWKRENKRIQIRQLFSNDWPLFFRFVRQVNGLSLQEAQLWHTLWLWSYFRRNAAHGYSWGVFENEKLVSATDAPDMPYFSRQIQEVGINTLERHRQMGYARLAVNSCVNAMLQQNVCPIWTAEHANTASRKLAQSAGFQLYGTIITISI